MNKRKLLSSIQNSIKNVRYNDFVILINAYGFKRTRGNGSHDLSLVEKYNLKLEDDDNV